MPVDPGWGWAAYLLPYVEQGNLFNKLDIPNKPTSTGLLLEQRKTTLPVYTCPSDREAGVYPVTDVLNRWVADAATNSYAACWGIDGIMSVYPDQGNGLFFRNSAIQIGRDTPDGTSQTLAIGERPAQFAKSPWVGAIANGTIRTTPGAPVYGAAVLSAPAMPMARVGRKPLFDRWCEPYDFFSPHPGVVNFVFADGSVHALSGSINLDVLRALATRAGGEVVGSWD